MAAQWDEMARKLEDAALAFLRDKGSLRQREAELNILVVCEAIRDWWEGGRKKEDAKRRTQKAMAVFTGNLMRLCKVSVSLGQIGELDIYRRDSRLGHAVSAVDSIKSVLEDLGIGRRAIQQVEVDARRNFRKRQARRTGKPGQVVLPRGVPGFETVTTSVILPIEVVCPKCMKPSRFLNGGSEVPADRMFGCSCCDRRATARAWSALHEANRSLRITDGTATRSRPVYGLPHSQCVGTSSTYRGEDTDFSKINVPDENADEVRAAAEISMEHPVSGQEYPVSGDGDFCWVPKAQVKRMAETMEKTSKRLRTAEASMCPCVLVWKLNELTVNDS